MPAGGDLVTDRGAVVPGRSSYSGVTPVGPNYTETSYLDQSGPVTVRTGGIPGQLTLPVAG